MQNKKYKIQKLKKKHLKELEKCFRSVFYRKLKKYLITGFCWSLINYVNNISIIVTTKRNKIIGFYLFEKMDIRKLYFETLSEEYLSQFENKKGLSGFALGVLIKYQRKGIGKMLVDYSLSLKEFDYIHGGSYNSLDNRLFWEKFRTIIEEDGSGFYGVSFIEK